MKFYSWLVALTLLACSTRLYGQSGLTLDAKHVSGLFEAHKAAIDSWQTGDVLIKYRTTGTGRLRFVPLGPDSKSVVIEGDGYVRFTFDFENKRFLVVNRRKETSTIFDGLDQEIGRPIHNADDSAGVCDLGQKLTLTRTQQGSIRDISKIIRNEDDFLGTLRAPLIMGVGLCSFPLLQWQPLDKVRGAIDMYGYEEVIKSVQNVGNDRYRATSSITLEGTPTGGIRVETEWDAKRQVPVGFSHFAGPRPDPEVPYSNVSMATMTVQWLDMEGHRLPKLARGSLRAPVDINGMGFGVLHEYEIEFHWFAINNDIPTDSFDKELLKDVTRLSKLVDSEFFAEKNDALK